MVNASGAYLFALVPETPSTKGGMVVLHEPDAVALYSQIKEKCNQNRGFMLYDHAVSFKLIE